MRVRVAVLAAALLVLPAAAADARSSYCSPTGDYCTSVQKKRGDALLRVATFSFRGRVRLCVRAPEGAATCKRFRLLKGHGGIFASTKSWKRHFPDKGRGVYRVRWQIAGANLGPRLSFRR